MHIHASVKVLGLCFFLEIRVLFMFLSVNLINSKKECLATARGAASRGCKFTNWGGNKYSSANFIFPVKM